jgi:hypothetical protein
MPNYEALAAQGVYALSNGGRVFAGQRDETFYIDLGATFDTLNLRRNPPVLTDAEDGTTARPVRRRHVLRFQRQHDRAGDSDFRAHRRSNATLGMYASTSRERNRHLGGDESDRRILRFGEIRPVAQLANPWSTS